MDVLENVPAINLALYVAETTSTVDMKRCNGESLEPSYSKNESVSGSLIFQKPISYT